MAVTYDVLKVLKSSHYNDTEKIEIVVPYYVVEKCRNMGVQPIFEIPIKNTPCRKDLLAKVEDTIGMIMNLVPGLYFEDFKFRLVGGFNENGYA